VYQYVSLLSNGFAKTMWIGRIGPGVLIIECIERTSESITPWISELTKAMYENWARLSDLRYIFITEVENADTVACVQKICDIQGLEYPQEYGDKRKWPKKVWRPSTPEFNALLGTRLGKVVAYFLLGAYGQGVKRIARIRFFHSGCDGLNLRFDIEDV
jgi:hypothetical protein